MKISSCVSAILLVLVLTSAAVGETLARYLAPDVIEGTLMAAECIGSRDHRPSCNQRVLAAGQPGGILGRQFTILLIDGRILGRTCAARTAGHLRAFGVLHKNGFAMSVFRLEQNCGDGWTTVDMPHTGTVVAGEAGGDE